MGERRALVTGASSGIGESFVRKLAAQRYTVTAVARDQGRLERLCDGLTGPGHRYLVADLTVPAEMERVARDVELGNYGLVVNNAGAGAIGTFADVPLSRLGELLRLNCEALLTISHAFLRGATTGSQLVNVASVLGFVPSPGNALYAATKAFVVSLSEALWQEYRGRGVYVMALCPGATATHFFTSAAMGRPAPVPPSFITQSADEVADIALTALARQRKPTVVCGALNKLAVFLPRLVSRKAMVRLMAGGERYIKITAAGSR